MGNDEYTFFDNESSGTPELPSSRAITVKLSERARTATLVASDNQPEGLSAASQGNAQTTSEDNLFVGWGILPYISEFDPAGKLLFNAEFPAGVNTYRAYLLPWNPGQPGSGQGPGGGGGQGPGGGKGPGHGNGPGGGKGPGHGRGSGHGHHRRRGLGKGHRGRGLASGHRGGRRR